MIDYEIQLMEYKIAKLMTIYLGRENSVGTNFYVTITSKTKNRKLFELLLDSRRKRCYGNALKDVRKTNANLS